MTALSRFEAFVESVLEGSFARIMKTRLQPIEIAKRLARAMESEQTVSAGKVVVPNDYQAHLNPADFAAFEGAVGSWKTELEEYLAGVAKERGVVPFGWPTVSLVPDVTVPTREVRVTAAVVDRVPGRDLTAEEREPRPVEIERTERIDARILREAVARELRGALVVHAGNAEMTFSIGAHTVSIGRGLENDVVIENPRVSRCQAEIRPEDRGFVLRDLKSTNGTMVNGVKVTEKVLADGDRVSFAGTEAIFYYPKRRVTD